MKLGCSNGGWKRFKSRFPKKQLLKVYAICFINHFGQSFTVTMLFPFLPFMVKFLVPGVGETELGRYVGLVGGALFLGRLCGSYIWGIVMDKKGRKPVIICSGFFMALGTLAFGFSVNLPMAVITRFVVGTFGGSITAVKAIISDVSDDDSQAFGLSIISSAWSLGFIIGPAVSGIIADPIGQYNITISNSFVRGVLTKFPYSIPCIVNVVVLLIGLVPIIFCLQETQGKKRNLKRSEIDQLVLVALRPDEQEVEEEARRDEQDQLEEPDSEDRVRLLRNEKEEDRRRESLLLSDLITEVTVYNPKNTKTSGSSDGDTELGRSRIDGQTEEMKLNNELLPASEQKQLSKFGNEAKNWARQFVKDLALFMCNKVTLVPLVIFMVYSVGNIGYTELFSLWASAQARYGGIGFSLQEIGTALAIAGILQFPLNLFAFAILERYLKSIKVFYSACTILIFSILMLPHLHYLVNLNSPVVLWILLISVVFVINSCSSLLYSAIFLFINNSVTFDKLGAINGLAMTFTSLSRCIAPVLFGFVFSLSLSETTMRIGFPLDYNLTFVCFSVIFVSCIFLAACLPTSINKQKVIEDD